MRPHHGQVAFTTNICFSQLEAGKPKIKVPAVRCLVARGIWRYPSGVGGKEAPRVPFMRAPTPFTEAPPPNTTALWVRFQHVNFRGEANIQAIQHLCLPCYLWFTYEIPVGLMNLCWEWRKKVALSIGRMEQNCINLGKTEAHNAEHFCIGKVKSSQG